MREAAQTRTAVHYMKPFLANCDFDSQEHRNLNERFVSLKNEARQEALTEFTAKVNSSIYQTEAHPCPCGAVDDQVLSRIDRYGIPLTTVMCRSCGLARSDPYYTDETLADFYQNEYRQIYGGKVRSKDWFFEKQRKSGLVIHGFLQAYLPNQGVVYEIGAGAGGILKAFSEQGYTVRGCDLGGEYIEYGASRGIDLYAGDWQVLAGFPKADVVILNHVLEHLKNPVDFLRNVRSLLKPEGILFIGVPGFIYYPVRYRLQLLYYLQNAHACHFCLQTLTETAGRAGFSLLEGNEKIVAIYKQSEVIESPGSRSTSKFLLEMVSRSQALAEKIKVLRKASVSLVRTKAALKVARSEHEILRSQNAEKKVQLKSHQIKLKRKRAAVARKNKEINRMKRTIGWRLSLVENKIYDGVAKLWSAWVKK
jgi:2-polyprenyl-3-methyl-5-hydroxy-6-metoxy-1,4-benzoquinol methylase